MLTAEISTQLPVYIFRVLHFGSMVGLSFKIISDYLRETVFIEYDMVFLLMTLISMGSGKHFTYYCRLRSYLYAGASKNGRTKEAMGLLAQF